MTHRHRCPQCGASEICDAPENPVDGPGCFVRDVGGLRFGAPLLCESCARKRAGAGRQLDLVGPKPEGAA